MADASGFALHVESHGSGEPLILLHGLGASGRDWEYQIPVLAQHFQVIVPDLRGFGRSPRVGPYRIEAHAAEVLALADHLQLPRFALVGHSMGGAIAQQLTLDAPGRVSQLVLANTSPSFRPRSLREHGMLLFRLAVVSLLGPAALASIVNRQMFPHPEQQALRDRVTARNAGNDPQIYREAIFALARWSVLERLGELQLPTLVIAAEHDYFSTALLHEYRRLPDCAGVHLIEGARHALPLERPDAFNAPLLRFLTGEPA